MRIPEFIIFNKKERAIILALSCILIIVYTSNVFMKPQVIKKEEYTSLSSIMKLNSNSEMDNNKVISEANTVINTINQNKSDLEAKYNKKKWEEPIINLTEFDPNTIDSLKWISLGVHRYSVSKILSYRTKGGKFRTCEDLYKIYNIDSNTIATLIPFCNIAKSTANSKQSNFKKYKKKEWEKPEVNLTDFDPNTIDSLKWISLGVHRYSVSKILNYRSKGGSFRKCEDLYDIYNIDSSTVSTLIPFCKIDTTQLPSKKPYNSNYKKKARQVVDINTADTTQLKSLYGIGAYLSGAIIDYRNSLGGFHSLSQLNEIYAFEPEIIQDNKDYITCSGAVAKININTADVITLKSHKYIDYRVANIIVNYRKQHGPYQDILDIKKTIIINDSIFQKIQPYLSTK
jgi:competence protein ComEA